MSDTTDGRSLWIPERDGGTEGRATARWRGRTDLELLCDQLDAISAWHRTRRLREELDRAVGQTREMRLDATRRRASHLREKEALLARADAASTAHEAAGRPRAVLAHRSAWLRSAMTLRLAHHGVEVIASVEDGADATAAIVFEQPDLVFVEALLPSLNGREVIQRAREFAPRALVGAHALAHEELSPLLDAGARAVFTRRMPPGDIADDLVGQLYDGAAEGLI
jgi:CheY-like chemotaxis protein